MMGVTLSSRRVCPQDNGRAELCEIRPADLWVNRRGVSVGLLLVALLLPRHAIADSAYPLLSGFDDARMQALVTDGGGSELAKLLYRISSIPDSSWQRMRSSATSDADPPAGEVIGLQGAIESIARLKLGEPLAEVLEFDSFYRLTLPAQAGVPINLFVRDIPKGMAVGDRVDVAAITLDGAANWFAAATLEWLPIQVDSIGHRLLRQHGFNLADLQRIRSRDRQSLSRGETDLFFEWLRIASQTKSPEQIAGEVPEITRSIDLLTDSKAAVGRWVQLPVRVLQVTRISIDSSERSKAIGQDHYYQIDAMSELGDREVIIKPPPGTDAEPITFSNSFPVNFVTLKRPPFLKSFADVVTQLDRQVVIDALHFRCWSYQSDLTRSAGFDQFSPLLMSLQISDTGDSRADAAEVWRIGYWAAGLFCLALFGIMAAIAWAARGDRRSTRGHAGFGGTDRTS